METPPTPHFDPLDLLTLPQVSQLVQRSRRSLEKDIAEGRLRAVHLGRQTRVPREEVYRFIHDRDPEPEP